MGMEYLPYIDTQSLQYSKMNIKSQNLRQITRLNTSAHRDMPISPGGTHAHTRSRISCTPVLSQVIHYSYKTKKAR